MHSHEVSELNISLCGRRIDFVDSLKVLGIIIDSQLSFDLHISMVNARICFNLRRLYALNLYLPLHVKYRVAHALLMSVINYGIQVYTGTTCGNLRRIEYSVNRVVRYVYSIPRREHISPSALKFLGCSFQRYVAYKLLSLFYKIVLTQTPIFLAKKFIFSKSVRNKQLIIEKISSSFYEHSFLVRLARVWNILPRDYRKFSLSSNAFNKAILNHFK